jgi:hypothetical protein
MAHAGRTLTPLVTTAAGQVHDEEASDEPLGWRWVAGVVRRSTARRLLHGRVTRAESVCRLTQHWRFRTATDLA